MLNIPTTVKNLLAIDGTRKNFRAHFPNGEFPDITNENVVQESVRYSASICSQDSFKFGLVEASSLEFETVGVGNMYGMSIDCFFDVDVSTLTAADQSALAAWTGDGSYTNESDSDIGFPFFSVPLGRFLVKRCPRNHGAMTHRQVTAYTENFANATQMHPLEWKKIQGKHGSPVYTMSIKEFIAENLGYYDKTILPKMGYSSTVDIKTFSQMTTTNTGLSVAARLFDSNDTQIGYVSVIRSEKTAYLNSDGGYSSPSGNTLYGFSIGNHPGETIYNDIYNFIENSGATGYKDSWNTSYDSIQELMGNTVDIGITPSLSLGATFLPYRYRETYYFFPGDPAADCFYPVVNPNESKYITVPFDIRVQYVLNGETTEVNYAAEADISDDLKTFRYVDSSTNSYLSGATMDFAATLNYKLDGLNFWYSFINAYSFRKILSSYCELLGMFCRPRPSGGYDLITLNKTARAQITPDEYSELWWDEYDIDNIGTVLYSFTSGSETQTNEYLISTGSSIYDMTDNYIIEHLTAATPAKIEALIKKTFKPRLAAINYTPIDLTMAAQLHLEPGDYIQLTAEDGTVIYSYIMRRELSGIQMLTDVISSVAGEIIETVEEE